MLETRSLTEKVEMGFIRINFLLQLSRKHLLQRLIEKIIPRKFTLHIFLEYEYTFSRGEI